VKVIPGQTAIESKGWFAAHKWLIFRRISQLSILILFLIGPWFGLWFIKGNLASSLTLQVLPLTDPYVLLQSFFAGHGVASTALIGALIVTVFYVLLGGRVYCSWVCPVNIITDTANWFRRRLNIKGGANFKRNTRYWLLAATLLLALFTGTIAWEWVNPVSILQRGLIFGMGFGWAVIAAIFLFDVFVSRHGWCGHLCPVGAFYSVLAIKSLIRVNALDRNKCDDCMDCYAICPEQQVISPALKGADKGIGPVILSANCTNCGRCIDVCAKAVFHFGTRFTKQQNMKNTHQSLTRNEEAIS
jgi:ferredoxin-type protein NapH